MKTIEKIGLLSIFCFLSSLAHAETRIMLPEDNVLGTRSQGMGGTAVGLANDGDAIFLNPAGVGGEDGPNSKLLVRGLTLPNVTFGMNKDSLALLKAYRSASNSNASVEKTILEGSGHKSLYGYFSAFPYITISRFQFGILVNAWGQGKVQSFSQRQLSRYSTPTKPLYYDKKIEVYSVSQSAAVFGFSMPYGASGFSLGVTTRAAFRNSIVESIEANDGIAQKSSETFKSSANATKGLAADLGMLYQVGKNSFKPKLGLMLKDVSDSNYGSLKSGGITEQDKMNLNFGGSVSPKLGNFGVLTIAMEAQNLIDSRVAWAQKGHLGVELALFGSEADHILALRGGHNGDGPTAGISLDLLFFKIKSAWYTKKVATFSGYENRTATDQRFLVNLTIDLRT